MTNPSIFKSKTYIDVEEIELSKFVSEYYGRPWRLQQQGDCLAQNSYQLITVSHEGTEWDEPEDCEQMLNSWLALPIPAPDDWSAVMDFERETFLQVDVVLWDLCRRGIAPEGEYLIRVWW